MNILQTETHSSAPDAPGRRRTKDDLADHLHAAMIQYIPSTLNENLPPAPGAGKRIESLLVGGISWKATAVFAEPSVHR